jgi:hypothetical protein
VFIAIGAGHLLPEAQMHRPGVAPALVGLATIGLVAHELTTERVVHELDVKTDHGAREPHPLPTA